MTRAQSLRSPQAAALAIIRRERLTVALLEHEAAIGAGNMAIPAKSAL